MMNTATPKWASCIPRKLLGRLARRAGHDRSVWVRLNRSHRPCATVTTIHTTMATPSITSNDIWPVTKGTATAVITATAPAHLRRRATSGTLAFFHFATGPTPIRNTTKAMMGMKMELKYGAPTEILLDWPSTPNATSPSTIKGAVVPSSTVPAATANITLLASSRDSRENHSKLPPRPTFGARQATKAREPPTTANKKVRMNQPRSRTQVRNIHATVVQGRDQRAHVASSLPPNSAAMAKAKATEKPT